MRTKILSKLLLSLGLILVLGSTITQVHGDSRPTPTPRPQPTPFPRPTPAVSSAYPTSPDAVQLPVVTIHGTGDVTGGKTGSFVLNMTAPMKPGVGYVNFAVSDSDIVEFDYI